MLSKTCNKQYQIKTTEQARVTGSSGLTGLTEGVQRRIEEEGGGEGEGEGKILADGRTDGIKGSKRGPLEKGERGIRYL